ncbi:MAG: sugar phosphate isomerase/epimerase [Verrucomicrobia bacterium]|nr:sugar phosphate isomerase/epimerase [Verrucomicrobiota bacterium]
MKLILDVASLDRWTVPDALESAARLKLTGVLLPLPALSADAAALPGAGVVIAGLSGVLAGRERALVGGETTRATARQALLDAIRLCYDLGAKMACVELPAWDELRGRLRVEQAQALAAEVLRSCAPLAESRRVAICLGGAGATTEFVAKIAHGNMRLACDAASLAAPGLPLRLVRLARASVGDDARELALLLGAIHYNGWLALRVSGGDPPAVAEAWLKALVAALDGARAA